MASNLRITDRIGSETNGPRTMVLSQRLRFSLCLPVWIWHFYAVIVLNPLFASLSVSRTVYTCKRVSIFSASIAKEIVPLPSPSSLIVSFSGRANRFLKSSFVGHLPSCGCMSGVPNMAAPEKEATPSTIPRAIPLPRREGNVRSVFWSDDRKLDFEMRHTSQTSYSTRSESSPELIDGIVGPS